MRRLLLLQHLAQSRRSHGQQILTEAPPCLRDKLIHARCRYVDRVVRLPMAPQQPKAWLRKEVPARADRGCDAWTTTERKRIAGVEARRECDAVRRYRDCAVESFCWDHRRVSRVPETVCGCAYTHMESADLFDRAIQHVLDGGEQPPSRVLVVFGRLVCRLEPAVPVAITRPDTVIGRFSHFAVPNSDELGSFVQTRHDEARGRLSLQATQQLVIRRVRLCNVSKLIGIVSSRDPEAERRTNDDQFDRSFEIWVRSASVIPVDLGVADQADSTAANHLANDERHQASSDTTAEKRQQLVLLARPGRRFDFGAERLRVAQVVAERLHVAAHPLDVLVDDRVV